MGLLTYRRQFQSRRGRSRRRVRRLARAQRRKRLDGSSSSLIAGVTTLILPAKQTGVTLTDGDCTRGIFVPALTPLLAEVARVTDAGNGQQSASYFVQLLKSRYELNYTPNWPQHTTSSLGITLEIHFFTLKQRSKLTDVINIPTYAYSNTFNGGTAASYDAPPIGYWNAVGKQQSTYSYGFGTTFKALYDGMLQRYDKDNADTENPTVSQGNKNRFISQAYSWLDSPDFNRYWVLKRSEKVYIPYGQSMQRSFMLPGANISYRDLSIPFDINASATSDTGYAPNLPAGWPMLAFTVCRHTGSSTVSTTGFEYADAMCMSVRHFWRAPDYYGRSLRTIDYQALAYPGNTTPTGTGDWANPFSSST